MIPLHLSLVLLLFAFSFAFGEYFHGGTESSVFSTLRRTDNNDEKTYHFSRITKYEPVTEPIIYTDAIDIDKSMMIIGFKNMVVFGKLQDEKHFVIRVNEDMDEDTATIPSQFLNVDDSGELFDVVTLKPTTPTITGRSTTKFPLCLDDINDFHRKARSGFHPDEESFADYLMNITMKSPDRLPHQ